MQISKKKFNLFKRKLLHVSTQSIIEKTAIFKIIYNNIVKMEQKFTIYQNKKRKTIFHIKKIYICEQKI